MATVLLAGCATGPATPVAEEEHSEDGDATPAELDGEAGPWDLTGVSPDGRLLTVATSTSGGGCGEFQGWVSEEDGDRVRLEARWEQQDVGSGGCRAVRKGDALTLELDEPLGERALDGCQRSDCRTERDRPGDAQWGARNQLSVADDVVVVTGSDTVWSLAPDDGSVRWQRPRDGHWSLAIDDLVLRYDHHDHIEARDAVTGELRWEAQDVTPADVQGDELIVCPREQALEDPPYESFRGALSLQDGSWLWREEDADCTTGALEQREAPAPDVDLDPDLIGHSLGVDVAAGQDAVYVATSTALVALDPETGDRDWWALLHPASTQPSNEVHPRGSESS